MKGDSDFDFDAIKNVNVTPQEKKAAQKMNKLVEDIENLANCCEDEIMFKILREDVLKLCAKRHEIMKEG